MYTAGAFFASLVLFAPLQTYAAILQLLPTGNSWSIGDTFAADVKIDTKGANINAAQATITFPSTILQVTSIDKTNSAFSFWLQDPIFSNPSGTIQFTGGTPTGISGSALQTLRINFKVIAIGAGDLGASGAGVIADDGEGTNILSQIVTAHIVAGQQIVAAAPVVLRGGPEQVTRTAVTAVTLPSKPILKVPSYPDPSRSYNQIGNATVFWGLPDDVTQVATGISQSPATVPGTIGTQLSTGKDFGMLKDGVWFIAVQFKNNIGWGPVATYRISIDTQPPLSFDIKFDSAVSDNPAPKITYGSSDSLSGIANYQVFIDEKNVTTTILGAMTLPPQYPGSHIILVKAFDKAGNNAQATGNFQILPLASPTVDFFTKSVVQGDLVFISGKSLPNSNVDISFLDGRKQKVLTDTVSSNALGNWNITVDQPFGLGSYTMAVVARDVRNAVSFPVAAGPITVREKPVLSIGLLNLGWPEIMLVIILAIVAIGSVFLWRNALAKDKRRAYAIIAGRDVENLATVLQDDLGHLTTTYSSFTAPSPGATNEVAVLIKRMQDTLGKLKKYVGEEVRKGQ
jgi:hypothetical protein